MQLDKRRMLDLGVRLNFDLFVRRCFQTLNSGRAFKENWHHHAIFHALSQVRDGDLTRLIVNVQPRSLKSLIVSIAYPAFVLGHDPSKRVYVISYGDDLAHKHANDFRAVVESPWYRRAFPKTEFTRLSMDAACTSVGGYRRSTTVMGALTGLGGDVFILDDPQKAVDAQSEARRKTLNQWFGNTLISRLDDKQTGTIIVVMQRVHMNDLCGHLTETSDEWTTLRLPAIAEADERIQTGPDTYHDRKAGEALQPDHEPLEILDQLQQTIPPDVFAAQFQQCPVAPGGVMIKRDWLSYYAPHELPERTYRTKVILSIDTATKDSAHNDWSVCSAWLIDGGLYYLLDLVRGRFEYPQLKQMVITQAQRHKPSMVLIEDALTGTALAQELKSTGQAPVTRVRVERDKIGRMYLQQEKFFAGQVLFPANAPFLNELEGELLAFPNGRHDDQVDSISQALNYRLTGYTLDHL